MELQRQGRGWSCKDKAGWRAEQRGGQVEGWSGEPGQDGGEGEAQGSAQSSAQTGRRELKILKLNSEREVLREGRPFSEVEQLWSSSVPQTLPLEKSHSLSWLLFK